ncbi:6-phosphogluconate dehydrogenase-like protein [Promicromonospora sp. AC04]|uniref:NAD(P)-binding domain-containing protein n=1 Tax=Promicromonospora sp. AC04 TaxID=2135723 RepID=UPI000D43564D|nr:NAD(P)-binding domain-containing protein [Promicromonospora sp. AC04]PUB27985.1 6-phosphogluconate dehydrogenase-like protein [Promicromonospora sp. AC04]
MSTPVTLIGLGPMGQAMVRTLLAEGHQVTVWNRTPSRAADVVAAGAKLAATPADALAASELLILSLADGLPAAVQAYYTWAREHGHGGDNWTRIIDAMRPQAVDVVPAA